MEKMNRRSSIRNVVTLLMGSCASFSPFLSQRTVGACGYLSQGFEVEFPCMGSKINLRWFDKRSNSTELVLAAAVETSEKWVNVLSDYEPISEAMTVCQEADSGSWVQVSEDLWTVIQMCDQWNRWSNGAFDAALGALTRLRRQRRLANSKQWKESRSKSGWKLVELHPSEHRIRMIRPGVRFDFGAIGKGFVVDQISNKLLAMEIEQFVINSAGNMRMGRAPDNSDGWPLSIDVPTPSSTDPTREYCRMRLKQCGIATSGDRWQKFPDAIDIRESDSEPSLSSHIVDPKSLRGISGHHSVTVIAENATDADAIATATSVRTQNDLAGWLQTVELIKPGTRVLILSKDKESTGIRSRYSGVAY